MLEIVNAVLPVVGGVAIVLLALLGLTVLIAIFKVLHALTKSEF